MSRWALVPIKGFDRGKSRLAEVLPPAERARLARELFEHVIDVLRTSPAIDGVAVVSNSHEAREHARHLGVLPLADAAGSEGSADVVDGALVELERRTWRACPSNSTKAMSCWSPISAGAGPTSWRSSQPPAFRAASVMRTAFDVTMTKRGAWV